MQTIVVAIDRAEGATMGRAERAFLRSGRSRHALRRAAMLAIEHGMRLDVVHVTPGPDALGGLLGDALALAATRARRHLARLARALAPAPPEVVTRVLHGRIVPALAEHVAATLPALIVLGPHLGRPLADLVRRTTAERLVGRVPCPLLVVKRRPLGSYTSALVALALDAVDGALLAAQRRFAPAARVTALHVHDPPLVTRLVAGDVPVDAVAAFRNRQLDAVGARLRRHLTALGAGHHAPLLRRGKPAHEALAVAAGGGHDLIVVGRSGGLVRDVMLGSVSRHLLGRARADVLIVPRDPGGVG
ncbi:MAG: universal stress protein [Deltaproteobacteria bacterium]|nr:universal stress protein [Deltaproteobacteria bacterium]